MLGAYSELVVDWDTQAAQYSVSTEFICYASSNLIVLRTIFRHGISHGASTYRFEPDFDNFNSSTQPIVNFPSFKLGPEAIVSSMGHIEWAGEFSFAQNNWGVSLSGYVGGQLGGPVVLHQPVWSTGSKPQAAVLGALSNFKDTILGIVPDPVVSGSFRWVFGPHGHLDALPAGFTAELAILAPSVQAPGRFAVYPGDAGITAAVYEFGSMLRAVYNTTRFTPASDMGVTALSYWSDNGQVYDGDYWEQQGCLETAGEVFTGLQSWYGQHGVPVQSYQLDPYWFSRGTPGNGNWTAAPTIWGPNGFQQALDAGMRFTLYTFFWAVPPHNTFTEFSWKVSPKMNNFVGGPIAQVAAEDSLAFHTELMRRCKLWKCVGFESDFMDFNYFAFNENLNITGHFAQWLDGMSAAAVTAGIPVQLCMPLPSDLLLSVQLPGVSNIRASSDNDLTYADGNRWRIGLTSMLQGALNTRPFFDGMWTYPTYSSADATDVPYPAGYTQNATELGIAISLLSTGPIGLGDKLGFTNATLASLTCASNGVLLKPSLPAAPVDRYFLYDQPAGTSLLQVGQAELWNAPNFVPILPPGQQAVPDWTSTLHGRRSKGLLTGSLEQYLHSTVASLGDTFPAVTPCPFASVLATEIASTLNFTLYPGDLTPSLVSWDSASVCGAAGLTRGYVATPWSPGLSAVAARCADGEPASSCVLSFDSRGLAISTGANPNVDAKGAYHPFDIFSLSPILTSGYTLLGELGKFVRVSPLRVSAVSAHCSGTGGTVPGLSVIVNGAANEQVNMAVLAPNVASAACTSSHQPPSGSVVDLSQYIVRTVAVSFGASGGAQLLTCSGLAGEAACSASDWDASGL